jgi:hypothetical protein
MKHSLEKITNEMMKLRWRPYPDTAVYNLGFFVREFTVMHWSRVLCQEAQERCAEAEAVNA